jgi:hypothetical protein
MIGKSGFSLLRRLHKGAEHHTASYAVGTRSCFPGIKSIGDEADHEPPPSAEVKNDYIPTSMPSPIFVA